MARDDADAWIKAQRIVFQAGDGAVLKWDGSTFNKELYQNGHCRPLPSGESSQQGIMTGRGFGEELQQSAI